jgi:hypothetical protein
MPECDGWFDERSIPFHPSAEDRAVREVYIWDVYDPAYKKWLIDCWFGVTYGTWIGNRFDRRDAGVKMAAWLTRHGYANFEQLTEVNHGND